MTLFGLDTMTMELVLRLFASVALGALVGLEREITHKPAGLRTHVLVCMGACLFTIASFYMIPPDTTIENADYSRIAAGIVTGIGFIGAGSIIATKGQVRGVTTAASLWIVAAIGLMAGMGQYIIALIAASLSFFVLKIGKVERELENEIIQKSNYTKKSSGIKVDESSRKLNIELRLPEGVSLGERRVRREKE